MVHSITVLDQLRVQVLCLAQARAALERHVSPRSEDPPPSESKRRRCAGPGQDAFVPVEASARRGANAGVGLGQRYV